ncbi:phosphate/phosphite/phosphonate ABC transporter substrate-binding protein [Micromonospora sp. ZYX-F-536]|uniref:phosphate/phosphite/phosphonate ABC transporter substrate-binding protein n=1 Tax=Micromonospora sp. ZYX-F-536 TaxID=3457629 RepID=UPI004040A2A9
MAAPAVLMGAVAYDPKVVTIWEGFRAWLRGRGLDFDFVLYSHYERQVEDLVAGRIDAAWNSPLAWLRAERLAAASGSTVRALTMRDTDRDLTSVVVVRADSPARQAEDLAGRLVAVGAVDSPQATLIPLGHLAAAGVEVDVRRFDVGVGLHGDHIGGERDAARALMAEEVDAACMIDANHLAFVREGTLPPEGTRIVAQTARYDHCNMTVRDPANDGVRLFGTLLRGMSYADPQVRPLLDLEGLTVWEDGRTTGYDALARAVDASGFYAADGRVTAEGYRP